MIAQADEARGRSPWLAVAIGALRAAFGVIWAIDAALAWQPIFADHYVGYLQNAIHGQPMTTTK